MGAPRSAPTTTSSWPNSTSPRDGRYIEQIGTHNPLLPKDNADRVKLDMDRVKHWLSVGAQPTDRVARFLDAAGLAKREGRNNPNKAKPKKKRLEREAAAAEAAKRRRRRGQAGGVGAVAEAQSPPHSARPHRRGARHPRRGADQDLHRGAGEIGAYGPLATRAGARTFNDQERARDAQRAWSRASRASPTATLPKPSKASSSTSSATACRAAAEGEFYHADLIGLAAVDPEGKPLGEIVAVQNFGAGDLLEIRLTGSGKTELVPFTDATVPEVDIAARRVVVILPSEAHDET